MYKYLDRIKDAQDIKNIREDEMVFLARDIRKFLVNIV